MKPSAPPRVANHYDFWTAPPPSPSERCTWWVARIRAGWRPNARISGMGYDSTARWFGVYMWEYLRVLYPLLGGRYDHDDEPLPEAFRHLLPADPPLHDPRRPPG